MRRLTYIMIASSIFMLAVFTVAANWLPADATTVLGPMSICLSRGGARRAGPRNDQCGGIGMKTGGVPDIRERALISSSLAPWGFR